MSGLLLADMRSELSEHLGVDTEYSSAWKDLLINRSFWSVTDLYPFRLKETNSSIDTVAGTRRYEIPILSEMIKNVVIEDSDSGQHTPLRRMSLVDYETKYQNNTDALGTPEKYLRYEDDFIIYPTPNDVFTLIIHYLTIFDDLTDANDDPEIPRVWHEIILYGAVWRGFLKLRDFAASREFKAQQAALVNDIQPTEAKEESDSRYSGLSIPEDLLRVDYQG